MNAIVAPYHSTEFDASKCVGRRAGDEDLDPAERPVREAGGGEAEGFEMSEHDLIRHASHGDDVSDAIVFHDAGRPEAEADRQTASSGDGDHIDSANRIEED
jgi:hypothetical protein